MFKAFVQIPKLRAMPEYQLLSGSKSPDVSLLYLMWLRFLFKPTTYGYAQPWWATLNYFQSGYNVML